MIEIICVGKIKEKFFDQAISEYQKRLSKYTKLKITEIPDFNLDEVSTIKKESEIIISKLDNKSYKICMDINGEQLSSVDLSKKIENTLITNSDITFIIGGSYGLSDEVKKICNYRLSFSKLTFPHQLFRIILLEQIYRSFKILNNETYHK